MPLIDYKGTHLQVDEDGFLADPSLWDENLARFLAEHEEGIADLTPQHWKVIDYLHRYYTENGVAPMVRLLCKETDLKLKQIYELFPSGPARGACKVAGLPKPTGCV
jgi:TusE/DsrC/DsvC family sulfur relay protein